MRWDNLFDDLEGQLEHELGTEEVDLRAEEERLRLGRLSLRDRIAAVHASHSNHADYSLRVQLTDGSFQEVHPTTVGRDWFSADVLGDGARRRECVIPLTAIGALILSRQQVLQSLTAAAPGDAEHGLSARLTMSFLLRDLCRRRASVELRLADNSGYRTSDPTNGATTTWGTIDRVGRDHLDLAVHDAGSARRESAVREYRIIPFDRVLFVRI